MTSTQTLRTTFVAVVAALLLALIPVLGVSAQSYDGDTVAPDDSGNYSVDAQSGDTVTLTDTGGTGGTLAIEFANGVSGGTVNVTSSTTVPSEASSAAPGTVGVYLDVDLTGLTNADIEGAVWTFTVTDTFLSDNGVTTENVFLYHFTGGEWVQQPTSFVSASGGVNTFQATLDSFSPFAVTAVAGLSNTGAPVGLSLMVAAGIIGSLGAIYVVGRRGEKVQG